MRKPMRFWKQYSNVLHPTSKASKAAEPLRRAASVAPPTNPKQIFTIVPPSPALSTRSLGCRN